MEIVEIPAHYRLLREQVREAGLLDRRPAHYALRMVLTVSAYAGGWVAVALVGNSWWSLVCAAALAVLFTQVVFIGHDAGHGQIFSSRRRNRLLGLVVGDLLCGVSFGWWVPKHNAHHARPNEPGLDPDLGGGVLALTAASVSRPTTSRAGRILAGWRAWLFVPLLMLQGLGLHVTSADWLARRRDRPAAVEITMLVAHVAAYAVVVFAVLSPLRALAFIAVQQGLFGLYLGCSFAPNHKGMPMLPAGSSMPSAMRQVITARNVKSGRVVDLLLGGLNHQIEHHLFPTMCRPNLAWAAPLVRAFCADAGLHYCETSLMSSYRVTLSRLYGSSASAVLAGGSMSCGCRALTDAAGSRVA